MSKNYTLGLIKPLTVSQGHQFTILEEIERLIGQIIHFKRFTFTPELAAKFYESLSHLPFYNDLVNNMCGSETIGFIIEGDSDVIKKYRHLMGATNPDQSEKGTLRYKYAKNIDNNAVHGSDSEANATREIKLIFPEITL